MGEKIRSGSVHLTVYISMIRPARTFAFFAHDSNCNFDISPAREIEADISCKREIKINFTIPTLFLSLPWLLVPFINQITLKWHLIGPVSDIIICVNIYSRKTSSFEFRQSVNNDILKVLVDLGANIYHSLKYFPCYVMATIKNHEITIKTINSNDYV